MSRPVEYRKGWNLLSVIDILKLNLRDDGCCMGIFEPGDATRYKFSMMQIDGGVWVMCDMGMPTARFYTYTRAKPTDWPREMNKHTASLMAEVTNLVLDRESEERFFDFETGRAKIGAPHAP